MLIAALCVVACLSSCRTHKTMTAIDHSTSQSYVDTTVTVADTLGHQETDTDTTRTAAAYESAGLIEFVDSGGTVTVDSAGNITFEGVINLWGLTNWDLTQNRGLSHEVEDASAHREQLNGIAADESRSEKRTEEKAPAPKWYETVLARLGLGVCIAALIWLLFLYLKRKL